MYTLKKSLGQHFLKDENISRKIVAVVQESPAFRDNAGRPDAVALPLLEVGPGAGALTKYFLQDPAIDLKAVELDEEKVVYLEKTWPSLKGKIIQGSILDIQLPFEGKFTVVGNFPYNISSQILFRMLEWRSSIISMTGMFQKEVALRAAAGPGNKTYGVLSVLIQAFFDVDYLFEVAEQSFNPPPKVKSAVIRLTPRAKLPVMRDERTFFLLVKTSFNQRRKTLRNAVKGLFEPAVLADPRFRQRAEQLSVEDFAELTWKMR